MNNRSKTSHFFLFLLLTSYVCLGQTGIRPTIQEPAAVNQGPEFKAVSSLKITNLKRGKPALVEIHLENLTGQPLSLASDFELQLVKQTTDSLERARETYYCGFFLSNKSRSGNKPVEKRVFGNGDVANFTVDLTKLMWNREIGAVYIMGPTPNLFADVPAGDYYLRLQIPSSTKYTTGVTIGWDLYSNDIPVTLVKAR